MRIGIEAQRIFRQKKHGMDFVVLELIKELQHIDLENEYFIFVNNGPDHHVISETKNFKIIEFGGAYPLWEQIKLPKLAKQYQLDLLHCTSNTAPISCSVPLMVTIHDIIYMEVKNVMGKGYTPYQLFGNLYRKFVVNRIVKTAKKIITVSNFEKGTIANYFKDLPPQNLEAVYNGVSTHFKKIEDQEELDRIRLKYNLPDRYFLFLGNTDPKKNTGNALIGYAQYCKAQGRDVKLMVGDLDREVIKKHLSNAGLEDFLDQVQNTGYIPNAEMPALINMAEVFLYPSLRESFGIPLLEAMACGTPVLSGQKSSLPEVAGDAALLVDVTKAENIANGLQTLQEDADLKASYIAKGLSRSKDFSWENTARETLALYKELDS